jgi:hypothetical protein
VLSCRCSPLDGLGGQCALAAAVYRGQRAVGRFLRAPLLHGRSVAGRLSQGRAEGVRCHEAVAVDESQDRGARAASRRLLGRWPARRSVAKPATARCVARLSMDPRRERGGLVRRARKRGFWRWREDAGTRAGQKRSRCQNSVGGVDRLPMNTRFWSQETLWAHG